MDSEFIIAAQLSSLFPTQTTSITIQTSRQKIPLPATPRESDPPLEHAIYSSVLSTPSTGSILLRVIHGGLIIELLSLAIPVAPLRLVFPAKVLPTPAVHLWVSSEIHIIAVTDTGSLYRIIIPIGAPHELWQGYTQGIWPREYLIKNVPDKLESHVHAHGVHCIALTMPNGGLLRLDTDYLASEGDEEEWSEYLYQPSSFLSSLSSFLPLTASIPGASDIVSISTYPWPTDLGHIWTLSRDRSIKVWKAKIGCVASKQLNSFNREPSPGLGSQQSKSQVLLPPQYQTLLRAFSNPENEQVYLLAFLPSITASNSGGTFVVLNATADHIADLGVIECPRPTAHCHLQDFIIVGNSIYTLWDRQGQSMVERTSLDLDQLEDNIVRVSPWQSASYPAEPELTPAHLEQHLLGRGSLASKFLEIIFRPGVFSPLTLRTGIDQYTDACLSLPGPPPPQLTTTYVSIEENIAAVVACTVTLNHDPQTGKAQHANYKNALKRDWEGFIARCREIERMARWPLILGVQDSGEIVVIERERVGLLVFEDLPMQLQKDPEDSRPRTREYDLFAVLSALHIKLGAQNLSDFETRILDVTHQEIVFPIVDIIQDQADGFNLRQHLDEGFITWIIGRLQGIDDLDAAVRITLDVVGGLDVDVKHEEDDKGLLFSTPKSDLLRALVAAYVTNSIDARYTLCISLFILLFFLGDDLRNWDPSLLAETFAVFRGVAMLRYIARHPAGYGEPPITESTDEMITKLRNMDVSRHRTGFNPTYSLIHRLLVQTDITSSLPAVAHRFLDTTGLLQGISPSFATQYEVLICDRLRNLGFYDVSRELLSWLPRTPAVTYLLAKLWLDIGRPDDAALSFQKLAGSFGPDSAVIPEDVEAMTGVLPAGGVLSSEFAFYLHAASLFKESGVVKYEVTFTQLALSVAPEVDVAPLWTGVIRGYIELGRFSDAYAALVSCPYEKQKRECVSQLAYRMCEDNEVETLMNFNFAGLADEVEDALAFKARNIDPRLRPSYSKILYAWYVRRGDYRSAALTMYQRARKFRDLNSINNMEYVDEQIEAYLIAINALALLDPRDAWILVSLPLHQGEENYNDRRLAEHIPDEKFAPGTHDVELVKLEDLRQEYTLLSAQLDLMKQDNTFMSHPDLNLPPSLLVLRLSQANRFNQAMATARSLKVDMTDLFTHLTGQCLRLTRNPDDVISLNDTSDWLLTDQVSSWAGTTADRGWRYLRQALEKHDSGETDYKYTKVTLETILSLDQLASPPPWLLNVLQEHHHEYLIRTCLRYEKIDQAVEHTLTLIRKVDQRLTLDPPKNASATWLPYAMIDQVIFAATSQEFPPPMLADLRMEIATRVKRMERFTAAQASSL